MELNDFTQCLSYMSSVAQSKTTLELYLQYGTGLAGVVIGFAINRFWEGLKDRSNKKNKMVCIDEDVHRLQYLLKVTAVECLDVLCDLHDKLPPSSATIPSSFKAPLLEEFFSDVAVKYSSQVRYHLKELITYTAKLDHDVNGLFDMEPGFSMSKKVLGVIDGCVYGILNCDGFYGHAQHKTATELFKSYQLPEEKIVIYEHMVLNAGKNNALQI